MIGEGTVNTELTLLDGSSRECVLQKVQYVLDFNLQFGQVSKTIESVKRC